MSEQTDIPQPVTWAINVCAQETQRTAKIDSDLAEMVRRITATEQLLKQLNADKDAAETARVVAAKNAEVAREMAETVCAKYGWTMPEVPAEAPLLETQTWQAVPPAGILSWDELLGERVTVTYVDGAELTGFLTAVEPERLTVFVPGTGDCHAPVVYIASVVPAPPAAETTATDQPAAQDTKEGADHA
jgi:hypothetical protein